MSGETMSWGDYISRLKAAEAERNQLAARVTQLEAALLEVLRYLDERCGATFPLEGHAEQDRPPGNSDMGAPMRPAAT